MSIRSNRKFSERNENMKYDELAHRKLGLKATRSTSKKQRWRKFLEMHEIFSVEESGEALMTGLPSTMRNERISTINKTSSSGY